MRKQNQDFSKWHGIDRASIDWQPKIDEAKCIGCGLCVTTCGRGVYKFDYENKKSKVVNPNNCMVACQTCANLCPMKAISFAENDATREKAQKIVSDFHLLSKVKEELEKRKNEFVNYFLHLFEDKDILLQKIMNVLIKFSLASSPFAERAGQRQKINPGLSLRGRDG